MDCFFSTCVMFLTMAVHLDVVQLAFQHPASNVQNMWSCYTDLTLQAGQKNILIHGPKMDNKGKNDFTQKKNLNNTGFLALAMTSSWTISHTKRWNELPQVQNYRWTHSPPPNILYKFIIPVSDVWLAQQCKCKTHKNFVTESTKHVVICVSLAAACCHCGNVFYPAATVAAIHSHMHLRSRNVSACVVPVLSWNVAVDVGMFCKFLISFYTIYKTYLLTYSMQQSPAWEANRFCR